MTVRWLQPILWDDNLGEGAPEVHWGSLSITLYQKETDNRSLSDIELEHCMIFPCLSMLWWECCCL